MFSSLALLWSRNRWGHLLKISLDHRTRSIVDNILCGGTYLVAIKIKFSTINLPELIILISQVTTEVKKIYLYKDSGLTWSPEVDIKDFNNFVKSDEISEVWRFVKYLVFRDTEMLKIFINKNHWPRIFKANNKSLLQTCKFSLNINCKLRWMLQRNLFIF